MQGDALASSSIITITAGDGAKARVHLSGAHVTSWSPAGSEQDHLFVSAKSGFGPGVSIRGGIPVCFPQFGADGPLQQHGFARVSTWTLLEVEENADRARAAFRLVESDATRALWPHAFSAELTVIIGGASLEVSLAVTNNDAPGTVESADTFRFTAALHPYFRVDDAYECTVSGLEDRTYRDALEARGMFRQEGASLPIGGAIDRVYFDVPGTVQLRGGRGGLEIERAGFPDVVVWNPGADGVAQRADFHQGDELRFVCVEAAVVGHPVVLEPGATWTGVQRVTVR